MKTFLIEVKEIGIGAALSNAVVGAVYDLKSKSAIAKATFNCMKRKVEVAQMEYWEKRNNVSEENQNEEGGDENERVGAYVRTDD